MTNEELLSKIGLLSGSLRAKTVVHAARRFLDIGGKSIVETGTDAGVPNNGSSTTVFALLARHVGGMLTSIDLYQDSIKASESIVRQFDEELLKHITFVRGDSVRVLSAFKSNIDLLYLDSLDFDFRKPLPSQLHQLAELGGAIGKLTRKSIVLLDDYRQSSFGKCGLSNEYLKQIGARLELLDYQMCWCGVGS